MKKVNISANYLLVQEGKVYLDKVSDKILFVCDKQVLVYDSLEDYLKSFSEFFDYVHKKAKA